MKIVLYYTHNGRLAESFQTEAEVKAFIRSVVVARTVSCLEDIKIVDEEGSGSFDLLDAQDYFSDEELVQLSMAESAEINSKRTTRYLLVHGGTNQDGHYCRVVPIPSKQQNEPFHTLTKIAESLKSFCNVQGPSAVGAFVQASWWCKENGLDVINPAPGEYVIDGRKWSCGFCGNAFWVNCDESEYPDYCPFCGKENINKNTANYRIAI